MDPLFKSLLNNIKDKLLPITVYTLCLMGCVYQTYKISLLYFSYETTTSVTFVDNWAYETAPAITLCVNKISNSGVEDNRTIDIQLAANSMQFMWCYVDTNAWQGNC